MANNTDALLTPSMPHSPQAEQAVLGSMLIDADCVKDVMDKLQAQDFYLRTNREIFETIYHMFVYSQPIDGVTVAGELEKNGLYNDNTRSYLLQLMEVTPTSANVMEYVRIVQDKSLMRQVAQAAGSITAMVQEGGGAAGDMLEAAEQQIYAIRRGRSAQGMVTVGMVLGDVMSQLAELSANGGRTVPGLSTGLSAVDAKITGMNKSIDKGRQVYAFGAGTQKLYDYLDENPQCMSAPVNYTNDIRSISALDNFISINNAVDIDLYGQINAESAGTKQISGAGGQLDFVLGAYLSNGGKSFICMSSTFTAKDGTVNSRIRPTLANGSIVTDTRANVHYFVTEYGIVNLKGLSSWQKAEAIISVAHPDFRDQLIAEAEQMKIWKQSNKR